MDAVERLFGLRLGLQETRRVVPGRDNQVTTPAAARVTESPQQQNLVGRSWADPSDCVDDYTDNSSHCNSLQTAVDRCGSFLDRGDVRSQDERFSNCFCQPTIFSELVECQNQHRQCLRDLVMDPQFSHYRSQWNDFCTSANADLSVTTPPLDLPPPVTSFDNPCSYFKSACDRFDRYTSECQSYWPDSLSACYCQSHVVKFESICSVDGVALCSGSPIEDLHSLWGNASCLGWHETSYWVPEWAMAQATVDAPTTVPFVDFPLTYNDVPTETARPDADSGAGRDVTGEILPLFLLLAWLCPFL